MTRLSLILVVLGLIAACATDGSQQAGKKVQLSDKNIAAHNATANPEEQIVCRREQVHGSNLRKKVCRTQAQIDAELENSREAMDRLHRTQKVPGAGEG
jgi:hypothetical protein